MVERGKKDAKRHRDKQRERIKKQLQNIISEEAIITGKRGKVIKIPIKSLGIPYFKHGKAKEESVGIGQGSGKKGDVIGKQKRQKDGKGGKQAGNEPGEHFIETEIEIEELLEMMLEDLGLPNLEEKQTKKLLVEFGYRIRGIINSGPPPLLHKKKTMQAGIKRFWYFLETLHEETGCDKPLCADALRETSGIINEALRLLENKTVKKITENEKSIQPFPILHPDDIIFHKIEKKQSYRSRAVVFALMDVSSSMDDDKRYYAKSLLWWLVEFLNKLYDNNVEIRFIVHDTTAWLVPEEDFFKTSADGGTFCCSAYELTNSIIESDYPLSEYNCYIWHFSDGDDFDPARTVGEVEKLIARGVNMISYGEIRPDENKLSFSSLFEMFISVLNLREYREREGKFTVWMNEKKNIPFLGVVLTKKEHIWKALKAFLRKDR
jgi:hypothetical protein